MTVAKDLLHLYEELTFENYHEIQKALTEVKSVNLEEALLTLGSNYSIYQSLYEVARKEHANAEVELQNWISKEKISTADALGKKGVRATAVLLENTVYANPEYVEKTKFVIDKDEKLGYLKGLLRAMSYRRDALIQLSSMRKKEAEIYH